MIAGPENEEDDRPASKSQVKRDLLEHQRMARRLTELSDESLRELDDEAIVESVRLARGITKGNARKRQVQHIAKLIRRGRVEDVEQLLDRQDASSRLHQQTAHRLERWRAELILGNQSVFDEIVAACASVDRQQLRMLTRNAVGESEPGPAYRKLYQYLRRLT